jgi:hypothetical protein
VYIPESKRQCQGWEVYCLHTHDCSQLGVNLVLVLLIVVLELIECNQHDSLLQGEVVPKHFVNIWCKGNHNCKGLWFEWYAHSSPSIDMPTVNL